MEYMALRYTVGLDLGGTNIKGGVLDEGGGIVAKGMIKTEAESGPGHVIGRLGMLAERLMREAGLGKEDVDKIGVGTPGPLDPAAGLVLSAPNMPGWKMIRLKDELMGVTGMDVKVVNDGNAAAYGEYWTGSARDERVQHMILLTLGTGIGGGVVIDGKIFSGAHGAGTELGHMIVKPGGRPCGCGQLGCIEQYASATAFAREAKRRIDAGEVTSLEGEVTTKDVFDAAADGDAMSRAVIDRGIDYLGKACVNLVRIFDPQVIVIGGGVIAAGEAVMGRLRRSFDDQTWTVREERVEFAAATLGNDAGFIGAAGMARG